jgi:hypothetical protein
MFALTRMNRMFSITFMRRETSTLILQNILGQKELTIAVRESLLSRRNSQIIRLLIIHIQVARLSLTSQTIITIVALCKRMEVCRILLIHNTCLIIWGTIMRSSSYNNWHLPCLRLVMTRSKQQTSKLPIRRTTINCKSSKRRLSVKGLIRCRQPTISNNFQPFLRAGRATYSTVECHLWRILIFPPRK